MCLKLCINYKAEYLIRSCKGRMPSFFKKRISVIAIFDVENYSNSFVCLTTNLFRVVAFAHP